MESIVASAELDDLAHRVIGAAIEVHRLLGLGSWRSYLNAMRLRLGLLITFNVTLLRRGIKRIVYTH
jgi:hypothetical protein